MLKPILFNTDMVKAVKDGYKTQTRRLSKNQPQLGIMPLTYNRAPYLIDDILWVRETWARVKFGAGEWHYEYRADARDVNCFSNGTTSEWRPSIHMPKKAARLFLKVTDIGLQRLQDISKEDCIADGGFAPEIFDLSPDFVPQDFFKTVWDSTIPKEKPWGKWICNPWVWVIKFEKCEKPEEWPDE